MSDQMQRDRPPVLGLALSHLLAAYGWKAKELADAADLASSTISAYQTRPGMLTRERLEELARLMGLGAPEVERAVYTATFDLLDEMPPARTSVDPTPEQHRGMVKAATMAGREALEIVYERALREVREENAARALDEGRALAAELKKWSDAERRVLVEEAPDYHHWGLAVCLCDDSIAAAADDPAEALRLAERALFVAQHVPGTDAWRSRLAGYCTGHVGNVQKVQNRLKAAEASYARAWSLWKAGEDEAGLLSKARLLDLEASLRRGQRKLTDAVKLHDTALALAQPGEVGTILLNKSVTLGEQADYEGSIKTLEQAEREIGGGHQPRLLFGVRFNRAGNLVRLGRAQEAAPIVEQVRDLAERLRNDLDLVKTLWLEGNVHAELGRREEAVAALEQVGRELAHRELPFDHALASLDLARLYQEEGRLEEVQQLAAEMLRIFQALKVQREATAALSLFRDAAEKGAVTAELVRRLQDYFAKAKTDPTLHFEQ